MRFEGKIKQLGFADTASGIEVNAALEKFEDSVGHNRDAMGWLLTNLSSEPKFDGAIPEVKLNVAMWELDFTFAMPVYSATPRLLLQVPEHHRDPEAEHKAIELDEAGPKQKVPKLGYGGSPLPEDAVIIYPNQEGPQENVADRPVVQWSGIGIGKYMILGGLKASDEGKVVEIIQSVIGAAPEGQSIWQHYQNVAKIEDLADIMVKLREAGFGNQYDTNAKYLTTSNPLDGKTEYTDAAGLRGRDRDKELCAAIYVPGEVELGFHPKELLDNGGFAVAVKAKDGDQLSYRPVSKEFARLNYRDRFSDKPLAPINGVVNLWFIHGNPLRPYANQVSSLLNDLHAVNAKTRDLNLYVDTSKRPVAGVTEAARNTM